MKTQIRRRARRISSHVALSAMLGVIATAAGAGESPATITFDAPGAGTGSGQGTGCFALTDCSVVINDSGAITGYFLDVNNVFHGFARSPDGSFTTFDSPGADTTPGSFNGTLPNAINDFGAITGTYYDVNGAGHGFVRSPEGRFATFDVPGGSQFTNAIALNLEGSVAGYSVDQNGVFQGFVRRRDGTFATWTGPNACDATPASGCFGTAAFGINMFGTISGAYADNSGNFVGHGLVRSPDGRFTTYEVPGAGAGSYQGTTCPGCSRPLNQLGAIAGYYVDSNYVIHGYLRSPDGGITTFDAPPVTGGNGFNCYADCPMGLNDWGSITGVYLDANNVYHGFLRSPEGQMTTFDVPGADLTPNNFHGTFPVSINDQGAIAGYYIDANNVAHGFLRLRQGD